MESSISDGISWLHSTMIWELSFIIKTHIKLVMRWSNIGMARTRL